MPDYCVREMAASDALAVGRVHVRAWLAAYRGLLPEAFLDGLDEREWGDSWARQLAHPTPDRSTRVVVIADDDLVIGFAVAGRSRDVGEGDGDGELYAINVDPDHWGAGAGTALIAVALDDLAREGFRRATLWVLPGNTRGRKFYEARGWRDDGVTRDEVVMGAAVSEVRYSRPLDATAS